MKQVNIKALLFLFVTIFLSNQFLLATHVSANEESIKTFKKNATTCEWPALVQLGVNEQGPYCDGDFIEVEAFGFSLNGGIPGNLDVSENYSFIWSGDYQEIGSRKIRFQLDRRSNNNILKVKYGLTVDGNTCFDTAHIEFDILPMLDSEMAQIKWSPEDTLYVETKLYNLCYQWGKLENNEEIILENETLNHIATNNSSNSFFVEDIVDDIAIPKTTFDETYFVRLFYCSQGSTKCDLVKYFVPENFQSVNLGSNKYITDLILYPNPGDGSFVIESSLLKLKSIKVKIELYDADGRKILKQEFINFRQSCHLDFFEVPPGVYNVKISFPDNSFKTFQYYKVL